MPKKGLRPVKTLYVYNLNEMFNLEAVKNLFETFSPVESIEQTEENKSSGLIHFKNVEASVKVLCIFKNVKIMNRTLKITFAESEDEQDNLEQIFNHPFSMQNIEEGFYKNIAYSYQKLGE